MKLLESIEGCPDCAAEEAYKLSIGHECAPSTDRYASYCDMIREWRQVDPEYHRMSHAPNLCETCGGLLDDNRGEHHLGLRKCKAGQCDEWFCEHCQATSGSTGPVTCPACGSAGEDVDSA